MMNIRKIILAGVLGWICSCTEDVSVPDHPEAVQRIIDTFFRPVTVIDSNIDFGLSNLKTKRQLQPEKIIKFMEQDGWDIHQRVDVISASLNEKNFLYRVTISPKSGSINIKISLDK